ncbi:MAG: DUF4136 domain-containing protein [Bacteroides sp.]|nr:DUF4136 domain-containing protein [Bacteroides sp.]
MKKFIPLLLAVFAFAACEKDPDMDKLDNKYLVYTNYDKSADFNAYTMYYLPDSILVIGDKKEAEYWDDEDAVAILNAYAANMENHGYMRTFLRDEADLGMQVSYVKSTYYFTDFGQPTWWWGYPGYWDVPYWGNWGGGWYYPYAVTYSYSTGSFLTELANLEAPQGNDQKLPVLWTAYMSGLLSGSTKVNVQLAIQGVDQAFTQSPYLKTNNPLK